MKKAGLLVVAVVFACGGNKPKPTAETPTPSWLSEGNGAVTTEGGKQIHAIGVAQGKASKQRRSDADQKAKDLMAQQMDQLFQSLARMSEVNRDNLGDEVSAIGKKAMAQTAKIEDHWVQSDGTESALDVIDLQQFKQALQSVDGDDKLKAEMAQKLERAADQLAKQ